MEIQRFPTVAAFKEHFAKVQMQVDFGSIEQRVGPGKGRLACITEGERILTLLVEFNPNVIVTILTCVANFAPELPVDIFEDYVKEYNSGLLVVDMPEWCKVVGATRLATVYRSTKATPGSMLIKQDVVAPTNIKKKLRQIRNGNEPYNHQIQLVGYSESDIQKNHIHMAAMSYEVARYQYEVN